MNGNFSVFGQVARTSQTPDFFSWGLTAHLAHLGHVEHGEFAYPHFLGRISPPGG